MINWKTHHKNIPPSVSTGKSVFEILWVDDFKDGKTLGETRFDTNQIVIKNGMNAKETVLTYLHEYLHALSAAYEINLTETQVQKLEKAMPYFIKVFQELEGNKTKRKKRSKKK